MAADPERREIWFHAMRIGGPLPLYQTYAVHWKGWAMTGVAFVITLIFCFGVEAMRLNPWWQPIGLSILLFIFWLVGRRHVEYVKR